jgi:glutamine synthetase adenylyltransferase
MNEALHDILELSAEPTSAADDLARFEEAYAKEAGRAFAWEAPGAAALARIFGNSPVLAERLAAHPLWADAIATSLAHPHPLPREVLDEGLAREIETSEGADDAAFMRALRHFKYREMIRIVALDLAGESSVHELLAEWSDAADALIDAAYRRAHAELVLKHGEPLQSHPDGTRTPCTGVVIGLGKLGGRELNLSSDVDLIILYASDEGGAENLLGAAVSNHEFYVRLATHLTRSLATVTAYGFVFRVDHELRPEGAQGPLANSIEAAERYYESFGHDWERQVLIRARPVGGDVALGQGFLRAVRPFVYRRSLALSDLTHMREMKRRMSEAASRHDAAFDVKHGIGGIREGEFLVQALGLLYGGARPAIRKANTFEAIEALARESLMHPHAAQTLSAAYAFLRRTENMLQAPHELWTHKLPGSDEELAGLARRMGYRSATDAGAIALFRADLARHTRAVGQLFSALFEADYERLELMEAIRDNAARAADEEERIDSLAWFKQQEQRRVQNLDLGGLPLPQVLARLTLAAEAVLACAWEMAREQLLARCGTPRHEDGSEAGFAIVGMGSLGSIEIDYGSDLDLCFLFSGNGRTDGSARVTNAEYFTKLAQRIISTISLHSRYGRAYLIDSELRPSGNSGALVATLESFTAYHREHAQIWERLALLKARAITGDAAFVQEVEGTLCTTAYRSAPPPLEAVRAEILKLRERRLAERLRSRPDVIDLKIGRGGLADIDAMLQLHQLAHARTTPELWKQNSFELLAALRDAGFVTAELHAALADHLLFLRRLLSRVRLAVARATDEIDLQAPYLEAVAGQMDASTRDALASDLRQRLEEVQMLFERTIQAEQL